MDRRGASYEAPLSGENMFSDFYKEYLGAAADLPEEFRSEETAKKLYLHLCELAEKGRLFNLTAITDPCEAVKKHVVDSLHAAAAVKDLLASGSLIDIGSGGGFPALPVAIACPEIAVTALDSTEKKCEFISDTASLCGVSVKTVAERAEDAAASLRETFDAATARAVARLNILAELCAPFIKVGGCFFAMKGSAAEEERLEAEEGTKKLGLSFEREIKYAIDGGGERSIIIYKKTSPTPAAYPRRYARIKKDPL